MVKAAVLYQASERMPVVELHQQPPQKGEVLIKISSAGVCASDHHAMTGEAKFPLPIVLGHEGAGVVETVGDNVPGNILPGMRCVLSFVPSCGYCIPCRSGMGHACATHRSTGATMLDGTCRLSDREDREIFQFAKLGVFSESAIVPWQACHPIPDELPSDVAALIGCAVTTGVGVVLNEPSMKAGNTVAIFGVGGVGLNATQGAAIAGASEIIVVDIYKHKLDYAKQFGATHCINAREDDPAEAIVELTSGGVDCAFETFGGSVTVEQMMASLKTGGSGVMVGIAPVGKHAKIDMIDLVRNEKSLRGSYYGSAPPHLTFDKIIDLWKKGRLKISEMIDRRYHLQDINEAYDALASGANGRAIIDFQE